MMSRSAEETHTAGRELARRLNPGDLVLLEGPLGSGKTTFIQGIAESLGAAASVTSPSFVLVHEYPVGKRRQAGGRRTERDSIPSPSSLLPPASVVRHIDLYRLPDPAVDLDRIGLSELLADPAAITVVEWADRMPAGALRGGRSARRRIFRVRFGHGRSEGERTIDIEARQ